MPATGRQPPSPAQPRFPVASCAVGACDGSGPPGARYPMARRGQRDLAEAAPPDLAESTGTPSSGAGRGRRTDGCLGAERNDSQAGECRDARSGACSESCCGTTSVSKAPHRLRYPGQNRTSLPDEPPARRDELSAVLICDRVPSSRPPHMATRERSLSGAPWAGPARRSQPRMCTRCQQLRPPAAESLRQKARARRYFRRLESDRPYRVCGRCPSF